MFTKVIGATSSKEPSSLIAHGCMLPAFDNGECLWDTVPAPSNRLQLVV